MVKAKMAEDGRLALPADVVERHGLRAGTELEVEEAGGAIVLRTSPNSIEQAQALVRRLVAGKQASVDQFIAERLRDSGQD